MKLAAWLVFQHFGAQLATRTQKEKLFQSIGNDEDDDYDDYDEVYDGNDEEDEE